MTLYFLIGLLYGILVITINEKNAKEGQEEDSIHFNIIAIFIIACAWPIYIISFFIRLFNNRYKK